MRSDSNRVSSVSQHRQSPGACRPVPGARCLAPGVWRPVSGARCLARCARKPAQKTRLNCSDRNWQRHICQGRPVKIGQKRSLGPLQPRLQAAASDDRAIAATCGIACDQGLSALTFRASQLMAGGLLLVPAAMWFEPMLPVPTLTNLVGFLYLALIGAAATYATVTTTDRLEMIAPILILIPGMINAS